MLSAREIDRLVNTDRDTYPMNTECAVCEMSWGQHSGEICPMCRVCHDRACAHVAACTVCSTALNSDSMCAEGIKLAKARHGFNHATQLEAPREDLVEIDVREGDPRRWTLHREGVTRFLPKLECDPVQFDA